MKITGFSELKEMQKPLSYLVHIGPDITLKPIILFFILLHYRCRLHAECDLDIPKGAEKLEVYKATLAHKANHSFNPNMEWIVLEHPRYFIVILH